MACDKVMAILRRGGTSSGMKSMIRMVLAIARAECVRSDAFAGERETLPASAP
jgi:hypothetical protein